MENFADPEGAPIRRKRSTIFGTLLDPRSRTNTSNAPGPRELPAAVSTTGAQHGTPSKDTRRISRVTRAFLAVKSGISTNTGLTSSHGGGPAKSTQESYQSIGQKKSAHIFGGRTWAAVVPWRSSTEPNTAKSLDSQGGTVLPPNFSMDPVLGAAARQAARNLRKSSSEIDIQGTWAHDTSSACHYWTLHERDRESGISLSMDNSQLKENHSGPVQLTNKCDPLEVLPAEMVSLIFSFLSLDALLRVERVSRAWRAIATDAQLQRQFFLKRFGVTRCDSSSQLPSSSQGVGQLNGIYQDWKAMYRARLELEKRWDLGPVASQARVTYLNGHTDSVYCLQFDEDKVITGSRDRTLRIWDVQTGAPRMVIGVPKAYDRDRRDAEHIGAQAILQSGGFNVVNNKPVALPHSLYHVPKFYHDASILCLQYDNDTLISGSSDCSLIIWDMKTWQPTYRLKRHTAGVLDIAFDREKIISCSKDSTVCVWDRTTGALLAQLYGHRGPVNAVQMHGNLVVSASGEGCAKLWRLFGERLGTEDSECSAKILQTFWSEERGLACVEFSADGKEVLAGGNDQVIYRYDTSSGEMKESLTGHGSLVRSLYLDGPNERVISGSYDLSIRVWNLREGPSSRNTTPAFSHPDMREPRGNEPARVGAVGREMWKIERWATSWVLSAKSDYRRIVSTSQDGRGLIVDFGAGIKNVELLKGPIDQFEKPPPTPTSLS